jgi:hypothetical protein
MAKQSVTPSDRIRWRKIGGGFLRLPNRIIKPGDIFEASPSDIPKAFRDQVIPLDPVELVRVEEKPAEALQPKEEFTYEKRKRGSNDMYNIYDSRGKKINEKALTSEEADMYLEALMKSSGQYEKSDDDKDDEE